MGIATVLDSEGYVVNKVRLWDPPEGHTIGPGDGQIGDRWTGTEWIRKEVPPPPEE